jgi:DNA-directed RNA polymerase subunit beta
MRGSWIDFEFDSNDYLYVRIDKKKKVLVTTFLQALGIPREEIISNFYTFDQIQVKNGAFFKNIDSRLIGQRIERDMLTEKLEEEYLGKRITQDVLDKLEKAGVKKLSLRKASLLNRVFGRDVVDPKTGEVLVEQGQLFNEEALRAISKKLSSLTF